MNFLRNLKALVAMFAGGMVLGVVAALVVLAAVVVFLIPAVMGALLLEWERAKRWMRHTIGALPGNHPPLKHEFP